MDDRFIFVQTPVVTPLVLRSNKLTTKVTITSWLSGAASLQQDSKIEVQGNNIEIEPGSHQEVHRDRLKAEVPCSKGSYKLLRVQGSPEVSATRST